MRYLPSVLGGQFRLLQRAVKEMQCRRAKAISQGWRRETVRGQQWRPRETVRTRHNGKEGFLRNNAEYEMRELDTMQSNRALVGMDSTQGDSKSQEKEFQSLQRVDSTQQLHGLELRERVLSASKFDLASQHHQSLRNGEPWME
jgi:hypothetical protein